jgi:hypothetical protein
MALSPQDKAFYESKLTLKSFYYLCGLTMAVSAVAWPVLFYIQDLSAGMTGRWTLNIAIEWSLIGAMLGSIVSLVMYFGFWLLLSMGWLPSRR